MAEGETDFNILATDDDRGERTKPVFSIKIGSLTFRVKEKIFDAISKGKIRVYYFSTPVKIILSAEILEQYNWRDSK